MAESDLLNVHESSLLRNILANATIGIVETDLSHNIRLANRKACELFHEGKDIVGLSLRDLIQERESLEETASRLRSEGITRSEGKWTPVKTERHTQFKVVLTLSRDDAFAITGFLLMCEEVVFHRVCCACKRAETPDGWAPIEELFNQTASLSHTYCPDCMPDAMASVENFIPQE
jgi:PAS domain S-box-containing protein